MRRSKQISTVSLCILLMLFCSLSFFWAFNSGQAAAIIYVDDDNPDPNWYDQTHVRTIQEGIDNASEGDTVFVYSGLYSGRVSIKVNKTVTILGEEKETTIIDRGVSISASQVVISNFTIKYLSIKSVHSNLYNVHNVTISNNVITDSISLKNVDYSQIIQNTISSNSFGRIHLSSYSTYNTISKNTISDWQCIYIELYSDYNTISDNILHSTHKPAIEIRSAGGMKITNNIIESDTEQGIYLAGSGANEIINNTIICLGEDDEVSEGIYGSTCPFNTIQQNNITGANHGIGIHLRHGEDMIIDKNAINDFTVGIKVNWDGRRNILSRNTITPSENGIGISLWNSARDNVITENILSNNLKGIEIYSQCNGNTVSKNIIANNTLGIAIRGVCYDNTVFNNTIRDNTFGCNITEDEPAEGLVFPENVLYHNNFINNQYHAFDEASNIWDNGYPSGGNYWDDYTGGDENNDGIGDTPRPIPESETQSKETSSDRYPHIARDGWIEPQLELSAPAVIPEQQQFSVTVTAENQPVSDVTVTFAGISYSTGSDGTVLLTTPDVTQDTLYTISAEKKSYLPDQQDITVLYTPPQPNQLEITKPASVYEERKFTITVTAEQLPVEQVQVTFAGITEETNQQGTALFTAPTVQEDTDFSIYVEKDNYLSSTASITIKDTADTVITGWLYGIIKDTAEGPLKDVQVCVMLSAQNDQCTYTDRNGFYSLLLPPGTYPVIIKKDGYDERTDTATILENELTEQNYILEPSLLSQPKDTTEQLVEEKILANKDLIGAKIRLTPDEEDISYYADTLDIDLASTEETISLTVSADDDTIGTILVVRIGEGVLSDLDTVVVTYDGAKISEQTDVERFFTIEDGEDPEWLRFSTTTGLYILVKIPHFSIHTIQISSLLAEYFSPQALLIYIITGIILAILYVSPYFFGTLDE